MDDDDERPKKERNPFSFKTFIKKKEGVESHDDDEDHRATAVPASTKSLSKLPSAARLKTALEMGETPFPEVEKEGTGVLIHFCMFFCPVLTNKCTTAIVTGVSAITAVGY
jgi:hypothetical protein